VCECGSGFVVCVCVVCAVFVSGVCVWCVSERICIYVCVCVCVRARVI